MSSFRAFSARPGVLPALLHARREWSPEEAARFEFELLRMLATGSTHGMEPRIQDVVLAAAKFTKKRGLELFYRGKLRQKGRNSMMSALPSHGGRSCDDPASGAPGNMRPILRIAPSYSPCTRSSVF